MHTRSTASLPFVLVLVAAAAAPVHGVDDPDELMPGRVTVIKPGKLVRFVAKPAPDTVFALPGPGNDPTATAGSLLVFDVGTSAGDDTYALPADGWEGLGSPAGAKGFKYKGAGSSTDPCRAVVVKPAVVKAVCRGSGVGLTPPFSGDVAVVLRLGVETKRYCATFGGDEVSNVAGLLKRRDAPAAACPTLCGDGVTEGAEGCDDGNTLPNDGCDPSCLPEEATSEAVSGGGTVTSDDEADGATAPDPLETAVTSPLAGTVTIFESSTGTVPTGYEAANQAADITAPVSSSTTPLTIQFTLDASQLRPGDGGQTLQVFRDGVLVPACVGPPGEAYPDPCVFERVPLGGDDVRVGVRAAHASKWKFGFPSCGNGMLNPGETCDPPGDQATCPAGQVCKSDCTCSAMCDCCSGGPTTFTINHIPSVGTCGAATLDTGGLFKNLTCGSVYFGGGSGVLPSFPLAENTSVMAVMECKPATGMLTLGPTTALDTGNGATCTAAGCRFGAPTPIPNSVSVAVSMCALITRPAAAAGMASCEGVVSVAMPLSAAVYLTGDSLGLVPGVQPCPLCSGGTCLGGPNNGMSCTAETGAVDAGYPTSSDCPPDPMLFVGSLPLGATVTTGIARADAQPSGTQMQVFCGYCRDADDTNAFANPVFQCNSNADCALVSPTFESCEQRNPGAFGPNGSAVQTITISGGVSGCLADGLAHPATVAAGLCMTPGGPILDANGDLPGPAAFSLNGTFQLQ